MIIVFMFTYSKEGRKGDGGPFLRGFDGSFKPLRNIIC